MSKGWIALHKRLMHHWVADDKPYNMLAAWIDILLAVNWRDGRTVIGRKLLHYERGESLKSLDTWAERWGWNKSAVRRFLKLLEKDGMIRTTNETITTRITVCNYESYQDVSNGSETETKRRRNAGETQVTPEEQDNNRTMKQKNKSVRVSKSKKDVAPPPELMEIDGFPEAWADWMIFRTEIGKSLVPSTIQGQFKKLLKLRNPVAVIRQSIENGWQGLFEVKTQNQPRSLYDRKLG